MTLKFEYVFKIFTKEGKASQRVNFMLFKRKV